MSVLYCVIGPSGAGKDSLMLRARYRLAGTPFLFAHRYVTRPFDAGGENFISLLPEEFSLRDQSSLFWLVWQSHGLSYGIGQEVVDWLHQGLSVVVNGSRAYLPQAQQKATEAGITLIPVWIYCDVAILAQRLSARGRESAEEIQERLIRANAYLPPEGAAIIDNSGQLEVAVEQFLQLLQSSTA